jgi:hypothetical protein
MKTVLEIQSRIRPYPVLEADSLEDAIAGTGDERALWLVDSNVLAAHGGAFDALRGEIIAIEASEEAKSFEALGR